MEQEETEQEERVWAVNLKLFLHPAIFSPPELPSRKECLLGEQPKVNWSCSCSSTLRHACKLLCNYEVDLGSDWWISRRPARHGGAGTMLSHTTAKARVVDLKL